MSTELRVMGADSEVIEKSTVTSGPNILVDSLMSLCLEEAVERTGVVVCGCIDTTVNGSLELSLTGVEVRDILSGSVILVVACCSEMMGARIIDEACVGEKARISSEEVGVALFNSGAEKAAGVMGLTLTNPYCDMESGINEGRGVGMLENEEKVARTTVGGGV